MVVSVLERYREMGIMKAVGATSAELKDLFVMESAAIRWLGGMGGFGLGWAMIKLANHFLVEEGKRAIDFLT